MRSHDAVVERLPQIAGVRAAWSWLCTDLVTDVVPLGEPALCKLLEIDGLSSLAKAPLKTQRIVSHELAATAFARLQTPSSPLSQSDCVRLASCAGYGAHAWLKAIPSTRLLMLNNNEARTSVLFMLHLPHPLLVHCPTQHTCYTMSDGHQSRHADVFGDHEMVCRNSDKLTRHNNIVRALIIGSGLAGLSARLSNVLEMRRRLPNGQVDPSDQSKKQADLVVGPFSVPTHACNDTSLEILVDVCACHPTATTYIQNYALSGPGQCGAGANVIENRKVGLNKERLKARTGYAFNAFGVETYGALGDNAKNLIRDLVQEASANSRPTTNLYNWSASKFAESVKQLVSISLRRGIATQLRKAALARRNLEPPPAPTLNAHLAAAFNAPSDHPFTDAPSARPTPPTRQPTAASTSPPCMIPQPAIPPPTSITFDPDHQCTKCMLTPGGAALCPDAQVPTPFLDSFFANIAVEPFIGPPQAGSRRVAPQQSRVESHPGRGARGGKACPSGQSSPYVPATVPPTRAPPAAWVALARSTDSIPNRMPVSMPGTEDQGATTAASLFGVFKEAVSDDDSGFIDL